MFMKKKSRYFVFKKVGLLSLNEIDAVWIKNS